jgi:glutathione S-transferase
LNVGGQSDEAVPGSGPLRIYGSRISYYTGKLESYLRYRSIDYDLLPTVGHQREIRAGAGAVQMPTVRLPDGRWMSDSTPILAWLDARQPAPSIEPADPGLRFLALLIEDYADEWLWRPAMHYRWSFRPDRQHASGTLADELLSGVPVPRTFKRALLTARQRGGFVWGDGVRARTRAHVERSYLTALDRLEDIFSLRRFVLGDAPTTADFGLMGPMLRHFSQDPTPAELMRERAPGVYAWVARMWNAKPSAKRVRLLERVDPPLAALLQEICETHLVALRENALAYDDGRRRYAQTIQGCRYPRLPVSRYRVWCLEILRREWSALGQEAGASVRPFLPGPAAEVLWDDTTPLGSGYDPEERAPFHRAINVFAQGVPR